ncbi:MAG: transcriptional repressor LexA [Lachnospiraceae bacterium]
METRKISKKQEEILNFIKQEILQHGYPPTIREICQAVELKSTSSVHAHLEALERNGFIRKDSTKPRAIELVEDTFQLPKREIKNIPILENKNFTLPLLSDENIENYFPIPVEYAPTDGCFFLQVTDDTMKNAGIFSGSYVLVNQALPLQEDDFAVVAYEDQLFVRTYCIENGRSYFRSETDVAFPTFPAAETSLIGKVTGTFHFFPDAVSAGKEKEETPEHATAILQ